MCAGERVGQNKIGVIAIDDHLFVGIEGNTLFTGDETRTHVAQVGTQNLGSPNGAAIANSTGKY